MLRVRKQRYIAPSEMQMEMRMASVQRVTQNCSHSLRLNCMCVCERTAMLEVYRRLAHTLFFRILLVHRYAAMPLLGARKRNESCDAHQLESLPRADA